MVLGIIFLKKKYSLREYISIVLISMGIFVCTYASSNEIKMISNDSNNDTNESIELIEYAKWITGNFLLVHYFLNAKKSICPNRLIQN